VRWDAQNIKTNKMKVVSTILMAVVAYFGITVSCIWSVVEFILYLVKDKEFNWWSVYSIFICLFTSLFLVIISFIFAYLNGKKSVEEKSKFNGTDTVIPKRSKFQERLEAMQKERDSRR
jgi:phosphotransferase system  glucose/maltose/N-acetylglucosamine-specific IIC component